MGVISLPARRTASRQSKKIRLNLGPRLYGICRHVKKAIASPRVCLGVYVLFLRCSLRLRGHAAVGAMQASTWPRASG